METIKTVPDVDLATLRAYLSELLQNASLAEMPPVSDIRYRAMIAAQLDEIFSELRPARRL
jgi:hypothetical protein